MHVLLQLARTHSTRQATAATHASKRQRVLPCVRERGHTSLSASTRACSVRLANARQAPRVMPKRRTVDEDSEIGSNVGDDDDDEGEQYEPAPKKKAKAGRSAFIDDVAEDEDGDEDDEEEDGNEKDEYEDDEGAEKVNLGDAEKLNRSLDAKRRKEEDEKLQQQVRDRYESGNAANFRNAEDDDAGGETRFKDLPDASRDPKLWLMRCKPNAEKMLVISLMQKYLDSMHTDKPLQIKSAMCTDVKGYIYVEAYKEVHVREATQGLNNLFYRIQQVPNNEMTDVMRVRVTGGRKPLVRNAWCRMKRNDEYKEDLAQVVEIDGDGNRATVRLIPRLKIYLTRGQDDEEADVSRVRPPAKIFKPEEVASWGGVVDPTTVGGRRAYYYDGMTFVDGLLHKNLSVKVCHLATPPLLRRPSLTISPPPPPSTAFAHHPRRACALSFSCIVPDGCALGRECRAVYRGARALQGGAGRGRGGGAPRGHHPGAACTQGGLCGWRCRQGADPAMAASSALHRALSRALRAPALHRAAALPRVAALHRALPCLERCHASSAATRASRPAVLTARLSSPVISGARRRPSQHRRCGPVGVGDNGQCGRSPDEYGRAAQGRKVQGRPRIRVQPAAKVVQDGGPRQGAPSPHMPLPCLTSHHLSLTTPLSPHLSLTFSRLLSPSFAFSHHPTRARPRAGHRRVEPRG